MCIRTHPVGMLTDTHNWLQYFLLASIVLTKDITEPAVDIMQSTVGSFVCSGNSDYLFNSGTYSTYIDYAE